MYNCAECGKECLFHRHYQNDDQGKVKSIVTNTPTYYTSIDNKFIPFCSCACGNEYYAKNIKNNSSLVMKLGKYETINVN